MEPTFAIVEMMGHRRFGARVSEVEQFGIKMLRAEVLSEKAFVQDIHPQSIYAITRCTEEQAKAASRYTYSPAAEHQLPAPDDDDEFFDQDEESENIPLDREPEES